jgi:dTDP-4-amino-4,6-dideoxy-D-galactose acyltransferase
MRLEADLWLAGVLGRDVYRVCWPAAGAMDLHAWRVAVAGCGARPAFFYAKVPTCQVENVRALCREGFIVVDVNVTFERHPGAETGPSRAEAIRVRDARPEDYDAVLEIAGSCFLYSRFHLDPLFGREAANWIKREWVRNYLLGRRGEQLLVADRDGTPVGFLAVIGATADGRRCRVIDLVGVAAPSQGRGVGRCLVDAFIRSSTGKCELLRVGTQAANVPSVRLYEHCGFRLADSAYVLHAHLEGGSLR